LEKFISTKEKKGEEAHSTEADNPPEGHKDSSNCGLIDVLVLDIHHFISQNWQRLYRQLRLA
jgi:hypothetical protein